METLILILASVFVVSAVSLIGIITFLFKIKSLDRVFFVLVSFAAGSFLGAAFLDLIPEAASKTSVLKVSGSALFGIIFFFLMEKFLYWYHCHEGECDVHQFTYLNLMGDGVHNFLDGIIIASAFLTDRSLGFITTIAIIMHELPQELGDFGILVYGGFSKGKALLYNFIIALTAVAGAVLAYFFLDRFEGITPLMIGAASGSFIYIACTDLIPELHKERSLRRSLQQFILMSLGVILILIGKVVLE